mgnify:FL=1|jgi:N-acyl-L-homoserine lactone synthetase
MAIIALNWHSAHLYGEAWISHHRLRHRMFVDRQQWRVPSFAGLEYDQFDTPAAVYLLWLDEQGQARGVVRLIPTLRPYMVQTLWPELLPQHPPVDSRIWEASRFGCDSDLEPARRRRIIAELICGCQEFALYCGISRYLAVMPQWIFERVMHRSGCEVRYAGPPQRIGRHEVCAAYLPASAAILARIRRRCGIDGSVLHPVAATASDSMMRYGSATASGRRRPRGRRIAPSALPFPVSKGMPMPSKAEPACIPGAKPCSH